MSSLPHLDAQQASEEHERQMFGCTEAEIDSALARAGKERRDVAMYAMGVLSDAQELICRGEYGSAAEWWVLDRNANKIRQLMNIAKYAINKAVPR